MTSTATQVEIPDAVRDNSETVTDYAFMRHLVPKYRDMRPAYRDAQIKGVPVFGYRHFQWHDINPDGRRCRFDLITDAAGQIVHLFHTEYWTRVACHAGDACFSYASYYVREDDPREDGEPARPFCDRHTEQVIGGPLVLTQSAYVRDDGTLVRLSERLRTGKHA